MFPCKRHPISGVFFANLMKELACKIDELTIVTPRVYIPRFLLSVRKRWQKWFIDPMVSRENGMEILRPYVLSLPGIKYDGINSILMRYSLSRFFNKLFKEKDIDLILGYNMLPEGAAAVKIGGKYNLRAGFWAIGSDVNDTAHCNFMNYRLSKKCIELSDMIITESRDLENKIRDFTPKQVNVHTFYKGIDLSIFQTNLSKPNIINELGLKPDKRYILFVGRLICEKGIYELARMFNEISMKYADIDLILVGEEFEKDKLMAQFKEYGILDRVSSKGILQHRAVAKLMIASDLLVLPTWAEGLPNVVMEAMAAGLPVVTTDVGGIPEIIENGVTGITVPAKNVIKLTEAVLTVLENDELRQDFVINARSFIFRKFDVKKNADELYNLLSEIKREYSLKY